MAPIQADERRGVIGDISETPIDGKVTRCGTTYDLESRDRLVGATVRVMPNDQGTITDTRGRFEIETTIGEKEIRSQLPRIQE